MPFTHTVSYNFSDSGGPNQNFSATQSSDGQVNVSVVVAPAASNFQIICPLTAALVKSVVMWSDAAMTMVTKVGGATKDTFVLAANKPLIWQNGFPTACPITLDCNHIHATSTPGGTFNLFVLEDV